MTSTIISENTVQNLRAAEVAPSIDAVQNKQKMDQPTTVEDLILPGPPYKPQPIEMKELAIPESTPIADNISVYSARQKKVIIVTGSFAAFFSPMSSNIYFPALTTIAKDLHVSLSQIDLTVTTYQVSVIIYSRANPTINISCVNTLLITTQGYAGYCANDRCGFLRRSRPTASVLYLFYPLHCG